MIRVGGQMTPVVDVDVHEAYQSADDLFPYLDKTWQRYYTECGFRGLPGDPYVATAHGGRRVDSWPPDGGPPGSDPEFLRAQLVDEHGVDYAILTGGFFRISYLPQVEFAVALCSAYNDWMVENWLTHDWIYASLQVPTQDPQAAAREIDRLGGHPKILQILLPEKTIASYGDPFYDPVWEACVRNGLLAAVHPSGSSGTAAAPTTTGSWPRTYAEMHANFSLSYQAQVSSLIMNGTFVKFPELRVVLLEAGFAWLPHILWTLDAHWQSLHLEVPWLVDKPSKYIHDHLILGTQPIMLPERIEHFLSLMEMIDGENMLVYASDYPHWDFDAPARALPREVSDDARRKILGLNALDLYGLPAPVLA
jgi:predicted TIM-barrel fold metal-dependent hydrolase